MTYTSLMETNDLHILDVIQKLVARSKGTDYFLYASCNFTAHQSSSPREVTEWQQLQKSTCNVLQCSANNDDAWLAFIVCEDINCNIWNRLLSAKTDAYVLEELKGGIVSIEQCFLSTCQHPCRSVHLRIDVSIG